TSGGTHQGPMPVGACAPPGAMTHSPYFQARSATASPGTARPHTWHTVSTSPRVRASRAAQSSASWLAAEPSYPATIPFTVPAMTNLPAHRVSAANVQLPRPPGTGPILLSRQDVRVVDGAEAITVTTGSRTQLRPMTAAAAVAAGLRPDKGCSAVLRTFRSGCPANGPWVGDLWLCRSRPAGTDDEAEHQASEPIEVDTMI